MNGRSTSHPAASHPTSFFTVLVPTFSQHTRGGTKTIVIPIRVLLLLVLLAKDKVAESCEEGVFTILPEKREEGREEGGDILAQAVLMVVPATHGDCLFFFLPWRRHFFPPLALSIVAVASPLMPGVKFQASSQEGGGRSLAHINHPTQPFRTTFC